jgi:hypothetical protein
MAFIVFTKIISKLKRVRKKEKNSPNPRHTFCNNLNLFYPHNSFLKCVLLSRDTSRILVSDYTLSYVDVDLIRHVYSIPTIPLPYVDTDFIIAVYSF